MTARGGRRWRDGDLHRDDGPAYVSAGGSIRRWAINGALFHRESSWRAVQEIGRRRGR